MHEDTILTKRSKNLKRRSSTATGSFSKSKLLKSRLLSFLFHIVVLILDLTGIEIAIEIGMIVMKGTEMVVIVTEMTLEGEIEGRDLVLLKSPR